MARSTSKRRAPKKSALHVAIIVNALVGKTDLSLLPSGGRPGGGDWAAFAGPNKDAVVADAIAANRKWGDRYVILVGTLDAVVETPTAYQLKPIV